MRDPKTWMFLWFRESILFQSWEHCIQRIDRGEAVVRDSLSLSLSLSHSSILIATSDSTLLGQTRHHLWKVRATHRSKQVFFKWFVRIGRQFTQCYVLGTDSTRTLNVTYTVSNGMDDVCRNVPSRQCGWYIVLTSIVSPKQLSCGRKIREC